RNPSFGFGIVLFFAIFEFGFLLASMIFAEGVLQRLAWPAVVVGNLLAAGGMGLVLWRGHRQLGVQPLVSPGSEAPGADQCRVGASQSSWPSFARISAASSARGARSR